MIATYDHTLSPLTDSVRAQHGLACHAWAYGAWDCAGRRTWGLLDAGEVARYDRERHTIQRLSPLWR
jgi:hypothetical protein